MPELQATRTLLKSAPELWEACSDPDSLGRHLQAFGEIRITRVEPETTVAWEGERASGTVRIEPSGWGTRVTLTAVPEAVTAPVVEPEPEPGPEPELQAEPEPEAVVVEPTPEPIREPLAQSAVRAAPHRRFFRRLGGLLFKSLVTPVEIPEQAFPAVVTPDPAPAPEPEPEPSEPEVVPEPALAADPEPDLDPPAPAEIDPSVVLQTMLNTLGSDHHRPFSRS